MTTRIKTCGNCGVRYATSAAVCPACKTPNTTSTQALRSEAFLAAPPRPCAHEICANPVVARVGSASLCHSHYLSHHQAIADQWCEKTGLQSRAAQQTYIRDLLPRIGRPIRDRVPGEDDE